MMGWLAAALGWSVGPTPGGGLGLPMPVLGHGSKTVDGHTMRLIAGVDLMDRGEVYLDDQRVELRSPRDAIRAGIGLLTEDRGGQGLILAHPIQSNFGLPNLSQFCRGPVLVPGRERRALEAYTERLGVVGEPDQPAGPSAAAISRRSCSRRGCSVTARC